MKILKYKNTKNNCPKCNSSKIEINLNIKKSVYGTKKIKNYVWKRYFVKTEVYTGNVSFDDKMGPILRTVCKNFDDPKKNPQKIKIKVSKLFTDGSGKLNKTYNAMFCENCGYHEFYENATYMDVITQK